MTSTPDPTERELHTLRHALGLDREKESYRNYYAAMMKSDAWQDCEGLVSKGLMEPSVQTGGLVGYRVSAEGKAAVARCSQAENLKQKTIATIWLLSGATHDQQIQILTETLRAVAREERDACIKDVHDSVEGLDRLKAAAFGGLYGIREVEAGAERRMRARGEKEGADDDQKGR